MKSEIAHNVVNLAIPALENCIPLLKDTRTAISVSALLHLGVSGVLTKFGNFFNFNTYNNVKIEPKDKNYFRLQQYIIDKHEKNILNIDMVDNKKFVKKLRKSIYITYKNQYIYIDIEEDKKEEKNNPSYFHGFENRNIGNNIIFSSKLKVLEIKNFIDDLIKKTDIYEHNTIKIHYINKMHYDKRKDFDVFWDSFEIKTNKELKYVFTSNDVKSNFIDNIQEFLNNELFYKKRGLPYKTSFLLHGPPGCGKTSIIRSISNEYKLPIFVMHMADLKNHHVNSLLLEMRKIVRDSEKYIVLLEDFDRVIESLFGKKKNYNYNPYAHPHEYDYESNSANSKNELTMDCILNFLDGIDESYGRITLITANNINSITSHEALCRPGRIDSIIELTYCDETQVEQISKMYNIELTNNEINIIVQASMTPAKLINLLNKYNTKETLIENIHEVAQENEDIEEETKLSGKKRQRDDNGNINLSNYKSVNTIEKKINMCISKRRKLERQIMSMNKKIQILEKSDDKSDILDKQILICQKEKFSLEIENLDTNLKEYKNIRMLCVESEIKKLQERKEQLG
jgi:SpoVK/Ycf46/Vps4 family AAA+-type ATPase